MNLRGMRGFTLVEVVIALTLLSLIMLGLVSALRTFADTGTRLESISFAAEDYGLVGRLLEHSITGANPQTHTRENDFAQVTWFHGDESGLAWVGPLPPRNGVGGLYHLRLLLERDNDNIGRLMLLYFPYQGTKQVSPDWSLASKHTLIDRVDEFSVSYRSAGSEIWLESWKDLPVLPGKVRLALMIRNRVMPAMIFNVLRAEPLPLEISGAAGINKTP